MYNINYSILFSNPNQLLVYNTLKKKHNSNQYTYGKLRVNHIIFKSKTPIANTFYEDIRLNLDTELLNKFYLKDLSWLLLTKICLFQTSKIDQTLIPIFTDLYWTNYLMDFYELKFEFVNLNQFNEYEALDVSLKTFFNEDRNEEIEREDYIQYKTVSNISKRDQGEYKETYQDIMKFISYIDYTERIAAVKSKERVKKNVSFMKDNDSEHNIVIPYRRVATKRFGCLKMMKSKKQEELNVIVKKEEKTVADLALKKTIRIDNPKFKSVKCFKKAVKEKRGIKKSIEESIRNTLLNIYQSKGFMLNEDDGDNKRNHKKKNVIDINSLSRNGNVYRRAIIDTIMGNSANDYYVFYKQPNHYSIKANKHKHNSYNKELSLPKVNSNIYGNGNGNDSNTDRTIKSKGVISLGKTQLKQALALESTYYTEKKNSTMTIPIMNSKPNMNPSLFKKKFSMRKAILLKES